MKRVGHLYERLISDENLERAVREVCASHRWRPGHRVNETSRRVEANVAESVKQLRHIIETGFIPAIPTTQRRWDPGGEKWRTIRQPRLWPDQYVHHAMVQTLEPVMLRGMDPHCCGSIRGRGTHHGARLIAKWMRNNPKGTRYCMELDIRHFYDNLKPAAVMQRLRQLVKDRRVLRLAERCMRDGVLIGAYFSQWFANTFLQPLDRLIRDSGCAAHYLRYMDNFTIFGPNKRKLHRLRRQIAGWLGEHGLHLKDNWQVYPTRARMPTALGFRYGHGYTLLRKRPLLRLKRQLGRLDKKIRAGTKIPGRMAMSLLSRLGQLGHCCGRHIRERYLKPGNMKRLRKAVRDYTRKETARWRQLTASAPAARARSSA